MVNVQKHGRIMVKVQKHCTTVVQNTMVAPFFKSVKTWYRYCVNTNVHVQNMDMYKNKVLLWYTSKETWYYHDLSPKNIAVVFCPCNRTRICQITELRIKNGDICLRFLRLFCQKINTFLQLTYFQTQTNRESVLKVIRVFVTVV